MSNLYDNPPFDSYTEPPVMPQLSDAGAQPSGGLTLSDLLAQYAALSQAAQQPVQIAPPEKRSGVEKALTILQPLAQAFAISSATREWRRRRAAFLGSLAAGGAETALNEAIRPRLQREQMAERQKAAEQERFNRMAVVTGIAPNILRAQAELARAGREPIAREPHQYITDESGNLVDVTGNQATPVTRQEPVLGTMPMPTLPTPTEQAPPIEPSGTGVGAPSDLGLGLNWAGILGPELPAGTTQVPTGATRQTPVKVFQKPAAQRNAPGGMWGEHYNKAEQAVLDSGGSRRRRRRRGFRLWLTCLRPGERLPRPHNRDQRHPPRKLRGTPSFKRSTGKRTTSWPGSSRISGIHRVTPTVTRMSWSGAPCRATPMCSMAVNGCSSRLTDECTAENTPG